VNKIITAVCPKCDGRKTLDRGDHPELYSPSDDYSYEAECYLCNGKGFVIIETEELQKQEMNLKRRIIIRKRG